jgi:meso-butanediol dehydrogenase/(S,S)-butanediol dehydrogenase/diacetyl reductase
MESENRVAIVTGASRGIGRAISERIARKGVKVVVSDILDADETAQSIVSANGDAVFIRCDVTNAGDVVTLTRSAIERFGCIDILVNCAGVITISPVHELKEAEWDRVMSINVKGTFLTCRAVIPHMMGRKQGRIINISSIAGKTGYGGLSAYCASKFAVIGFTQALSKEMGKYNVNVNAICPGNIYTAMWDRIAESGHAGLIYPSAGDREVNGRELVEFICRDSTSLGRPQSLKDVAALAAFLISNEARNITGQAINIDAGQEVH